MNPFFRAHPSARPGLSILPLGFLLATGSVSALEIPFTPYKDGVATPSTFTGIGRTLSVRAGDSKAWMVHSLPDSGRKNLTKARLEIYVKDVARDGELRAYISGSNKNLENQTRYTDLVAGDVAGSVSLKANDHIQRMVSLPLSEAFVKSVRDGAFAGIILEGAAGLDAEVGALEGSHGAILYLDYPVAPLSLPVSVDSVAAKLAADHRDALRGAAGIKGDNGAKGDTGAQGLIGPAGAKGDKGDKGEKGDMGVAGSTGFKGDKGDRGDPGDATDLGPVFKLFNDRGQAAYYRFDRFSGAPQITPDSSGHGNSLAFSILDFNKTQLAPGDSVIIFTGSGYATATNARSLNPYKEITLSAKIRLAAATGGATDTQTVISKPNQYELAVIGNRLRVRLRTALGEWEWHGAGVVPAAVWTEVQATYDGRAVRTFVDGAQKSYRSYPMGPLAMDTTAALFVGSRQPGVAGFIGSLNDVKILAYAVGNQDSIASLPGLITRSQMVADSVSGLSTMLNAKAGLTGASFTGRLGIGIAQPQSMLHIGADTTSNIIVSRADDNTAGPGLLFRKARQDHTAPLAVSAGDMTGKVLGQGWHGTSYADMAFMGYYTDTGSYQSGERPPSRIEWYTNAANGNQARRMEIRSNGDVNVIGKLASGQLAVSYRDSGVVGTGQTFRGLALNANFSGPGNPDLFGLDVDVRGGGSANRWSGRFRGGFLDLAEKEGDMLRMYGITGTPSEYLRWTLSLDSQGKFGIRQAGDGWVDQGTRFSIDRDGDVGIGASDISGRLNIASTARSEMIGLWGGGLDGSTYQRMSTYVDTGYHVLFEAPKPGNLAANRYDYWFSHRGDGTANPRMVLKGSGWVGIGTPTPAAWLEVNSGSDESMTGSWGNTLKLSAIRYPSIRFQATNSNKTSMIGNNGDGSLYFGVNGTGDNFAGENHSLILHANGTVVVPGSLSKGSGTFDIPHPDSAKAAEGYRLRHSFVESPTRGDNIYRWEVEAKDGVALVKLETWFKHLNENVQVWVNAKGHFGRGYGELDTSGDQIVIRTDEDGRYNILAIGTRKDRVAKAGFDSLGVEYQTHK